MKKQKPARNRRPKMYKEALMRGICREVREKETMGGATDAATAKQQEKGDRGMGAANAAKRERWGSFEADFLSKSFFRPITTSPPHPGPQSSRSGQRGSKLEEEYEEEKEDYERELDLITTFGNPKREFEIKERDNRVAVVEITRRVEEVFHRREFPEEGPVTFKVCQELKRRREEERNATRNEFRRLRAIYDIYLIVPEDHELIEGKTKELEQEEKPDKKKIDNFLRLLYQYTRLREEPPYKPEQEDRDGIEDLCRELRAWWLE